MQDAILDPEVSRDQLGQMMQEVHGQNLDLIEQQARLRQAEEQKIALLQQQIQKVQLEHQQTKAELQKAQLELEMAKASCRLMNDGKSVCWRVCVLSNDCHGMVV